MSSLFDLLNATIDKINKVEKEAAASANADTIDDYVVELKKFGIKNDGTDSKATTDGINNALTWAKSNGYTTVILPSGTYLIDAVNESYTGRDKRKDAGIILPNNITFVMEDDTVLQVETNNSCAYSCIYVAKGENITIKGGSIIGDRLTHDFTGDSDYSTHEWGYGINVRGGTNINVIGVKITNCTGDGIFYGSYGNSVSSEDYAVIKNSLISGCAVSKSRRNNISVIACENVTIENNYITEAGVADDNHDGCAPRLGIDVEGEGDSEGTDWTITKNVVIKNNFFSGNYHGAITFQTGYECVASGNISSDTISYGAGNNITISNNVLFREDKTGIAITGLQVSSGFTENHVVISGNSISGFETALDIRGVGVSALGNIIKNCVDGIDSYMAENVLISGNNVYDMEGYGVSIAYSIDVMISDCKINGANVGIQVKGATSSDVNILKNVINAVTGIKHKDTANKIAISDNKINTSQYYGVQFDSLALIEISNNVFETASNALYCASGSTAGKVEVFGNTFYGDRQVYFSKLIDALFVSNKFINRRASKGGSAIVITGTPEEGTTRLRKFVCNIFMSSTGFDWNYAIESTTGSNYIVGNKFYTGALKCADTDEIFDNIGAGSSYLTEIPSEYITESELDAKNYLKEVPDEYVTETELDTKGYLTQHQSLEGYAKTSDIPTKTSQLDNDSGFLTEHQSLADYAKKTDIPTSLPASDVYSWAKQENKPTYTASEVGADPSGTATDKVSTHNTSEESHSDIRLLLEGLTTRLNALADSDDDTLDQMSEVVAYIKSNKTLIDAITTNKVSVSDIINNLTTNVSNKPLSAAQGVALKALIDAITVPTKTSQLTNDSGFLTEHQSLDGYAKTADHYTKTESDEQYQAKGEYLTSVPSEYVTETELDEKGYLTAVPSEYITETKLNEKGFLTLSSLPVYDGGVS